VSWLQLTLTVYVTFEYLLIGSLATYLYVDRRAARRMAVRVHEAARRRTDQARRMLESQLQAMQARVEPKFLFGTLAQVRDLYDADAEVAERMLEELITYLRAAMPKMRDSASTVAEEVELVRAYLEIVKLRLGQRLAYTIDVPTGIADARMPPMMMLPLADHAVANGIEHRHGEGRLTIAIAVAANRLVLRIVDSGAGYRPGTGDDGIAELRTRLEALYGPRASLTLSRRDGDATEAVLDLPLESASRGGFPLAG
jgi:sensor histidine kinase YesM